MTEPAVSIVMASYGRLPLLRESVASALAQDHPDFEIVVVDDGSDAATRAWLRDMSRQQGVRVVFQDHQGVAAARARGVAEARGRLVCILDSDDRLVPHALRRLTEELQNHPDAVFVHAAIRELRPNGVERVPGYRSYASARAMLWATLLSPRLPFKHSGTLFRRDALLAIGSYDTALPCKVDVDLYLRLLAAGYLPRFIAEPLVEFLMHRDSVSRDRLLGLRVWCRLIDRYGPRSTLARSAIKLLRAFAEVFKGLYIAVRG
jgi:alpha-1,6-rhamnosyltransferase